MVRSLGRTFRSSAMDLHSASIFLLSVVALDLARRLLAKCVSEKSTLPYPPGPKPIPFVGNIFGINAAAPWVTYQEWGRKYGDIVYSRLLNQSIIILNSEKSAKALLDQRSYNYSDRPYMATTDFIGWTFNSVMIRYSNRWRVHRRIFHQAFRPDAAINYRPIQMSKVHQLLQNLLESPGDYDRHLQTLSASIIMALAYGYQSAPRNDPLVEVVETALSLAISELTSEKAALLGAFPILKQIPPWFPGAGFKRNALKCRKSFAEILETPYRFTKKSMASGTATPSMVFDLLNRMKDNPDPSLEQALKEASATAFIAAAETSFSVLTIFLLAMVLHPSVQERAQAEIDSVVSEGRLPDFDDRSSMPYVEAVLRETLRWYPAVPLGVPHAATKSDEYEGYFIPEGATVAVNIWAIARDENTYPEPSLFKPERFLTADGKLTDDTAGYAFGFGRRICVGRYVADASLWATMVSMLALFKLSKAKDEYGNEIDFKPEWTTGVTIHPVKFPCCIQPRVAGMNTEKLAQMIPL
ncbi:hypothetical protein SERLA73DRAFT_182184 [Serpula lacrymans var. lacrymans S7.3]|uniref:Cytochrome P450 n=2 Tax=Serpula lacrymans var. lacrymans TaxID=341189 RepID=F8PWU0_SERL3|nr:uncharacterized protein SERLADRAFT_449580 [Serpula lacrymans var. lacrymans S7.9]EGN99267.1 hypothetical protein SERLA73DRAFT_182184 [Serpula lacrymans var. lacrymans S7.3]EGO24832.1 hypothetical protein SERLADRAFT_449580 [Serpula lacrymans var. lacrymans S7.9]